MLDLSAAVALSVLPGALGANLLRTFLARLPAEPLSAFRLDAALDEACPHRALPTLARAAEAAAPLLDDLAAGRRRAIVFGAEAYPARLAAIPDPPPLLWINGDAASLAQPVIAIVGSRYATPSSLDVARTLARDLAGFGFVIASGLARGVDEAAHRGALDAGATVARARLRARPRLSARAWTARQGDCRERRDRFRAAAVGRAEAGALSAAEPDHQRPVAGRGGRGGVAPERLAHHGALRRRSGPRGDGGARARRSDSGTRGVTASSATGRRWSKPRRTSSPHSAWRCGPPRRRRQAKRQQIGRRPTEAVDPILAALEGGEALSLGRLEAATGLSTVELLSRLTVHEIAGRIVKVPGGAFRTPPTAVVR